MSLPVLSPRKPEATDNVNTKTSPRLLFPKLRQMSGPLSRDGVKHSPAKQAIRTLGLPATVEDFEYGIDAPLERHWLEQWIEEYQKTDTNFNSISLLCEAKMHEVQQLTEHAPSPNHVRTAVACELLNRLANGMGKFGTILQPIRTEIFKAVYDNYNESLSEGRLTDFVKRVPFFSVVKEFERKHTTLNAELVKHKAISTRAVHSQMKNQRVLCQSLKYWSAAYVQIIFKTWAAHTKNRNNVEKYIDRLLKLKTDTRRHTFTAWKEYKMEQEIAGQAQTEGSLRQEIEELRARIKSLEIQADHFNDQMTDLESSLEASEAENHQLRQQLDVHEKEREHLKPELLTETVVNTFDELLNPDMLGGLRGWRKKHMLYAEDVSLLCGPGEGLDQYLLLDDEEILVRWVNFHLSKAQHSLRVENLHADLKDCIALTVVLNRLDPVECSIDALYEPDIEKRASMVVENTARLLDLEPSVNVIQVHHILGENRQALKVFLSTLFCERPQIGVRAHDLSWQRKTELDRMMDHTLQKIKTHSSKITSRFQDPFLLLEEGETLRELRQLSSDRILLRWVNHHLRAARFTHDIVNFTTDFRDCDVYEMLLRQIAPELDLRPLDMETEVPKKARVICDLIGQLSGNTDLLTPENIQQCAGDINAAVLSALFTLRPGLEVVEGTTFSRHVKALEELKEDWDAVKAANRKDPAILAAFCTKFAQARVDLQKAFAAATSANEEFAKLELKAQRYIQELLVARLNGTPKHTMETVENRDYLKYTVVNHTKLADLLAKEQYPDECVREVESLLRMHFSSLRRIFRHYAASSTNGSVVSINSDELWLLVKDCRLPGRSLTSGQIDIIFSQANVNVDRAGNPLVTHDRELSPDEFIEVLLRISAARYKQRLKTKTLAEKFGFLLDNDILPNACKHNADKFRADLMKEEVRQVFRNHEDVLRQIFNVYAAADMSSHQALRHRNTINNAEFLKLVKDCGFTDTSTTIATVNHIFGNIQHDYDITLLGQGSPALQVKRPQPEELGEMAFSEFLEALTALSMYKDPDPYLSLEAKLDKFLTDKLYPALKIYYKANRTSDTASRKLLQMLLNPSRSVARPKASLPRSREPTSSQDSMEREVVEQIVVGEDDS
eukprot:GILJ01005992.1.p1 GENE.GILJ01005992.1~~GILJ01005992.1.p1  ORF type:complete len:1128 (-),score=178.50 GILJ01005992.1:285-3668(-)